MEPITDEVIDVCWYWFVIVDAHFARLCRWGMFPKWHRPKYVLYKMMADVGCIKADSAEMFFLEVSLPADFQVHHTALKPFPLFSTHFCR